jgi:hypothetical protein
MADSIDAAGPKGALARPRFEKDDVLGAADLRSEQGWRRQRLRRHNRHLHGWGIICGLWVAPLLDARRPWGVVVCPGYALGPYGDDILVSCQAAIDLRDSLWSRPSDSARTAYVAIRYAESTAAARRAYETGCGCDDRPTRYTLVREAWRIDVLWEKPDPGQVPTIDLCHDLPVCAPCPPTPYVLLAAVRLPLSETTALKATDLDLSVRQS